MYWLSIVRSVYNPNEMIATYFTRHFSAILVLGTL